MYCFYGNTIEIPESQSRVGVARRHAVSFIGNLPVEKHTVHRLQMLDTSFVPFFVTSTLR